MDASRVAIEFLKSRLGENGCSLISGLWLQYRMFRLLALMGVRRVGAHLLGELGLTPGS